MVRCLAVSCLTGLLACRQNAPSNAGPPYPALEARIDSVLQPYVATNNFTGVILVSRGGAVRLEKAYGLANYELGVAHTPRSRFHIASVSKAFTAAAILLLEERGRLSTADPVARHVPDYPHGGTLRVEHLLKHTSGIPNLGNSPEWEHQERSPHTTAELVGLFKDRPLDFEPGSKDRYSNSNYNLLALILERVSGREYGESLRELVLAPLGLRSTLHHGDMARLIPDRASGTEPHGVRGVRLPRYVDWSGRTGSGSLVTTASDLEKFVRALFGGKLLSPQSLAKILAPAPGFAYGWAREERFGRKQVRAGGRSPGFNASVEHYLDDGTTVIALTNSYSPVGQDPVLLDALHSAVFGRAAVPPSLTPAALKAGALAEFTGRYQMPHDYVVPDATLALVDRGDYLEAQWNDGTVNAIYALGPNRFLDRNFWAEVSFTRDSAGRVDGFTYKLFNGFVARRLP